jgi:NADPH2:quinone reductase
MQCSIRSAARTCGIPVYGLYLAGGLFLPGRKRIVPYSIQWLKRLRPALFRNDLSTLLNLLLRQQLRPIVADRLPLSQARQAHELLMQGGVIGKIVLIPAAAPAPQGAAWLVHPQGTSWRPGASA